MQCNIGELDKKIRLSVGFVVLAVGFWFGSMWGALGFIPVLSALLGYCPAYAIFGKTSCPEDCTSCKK